MKNNILHTVVNKSCGAWDFFETRESWLWVFVISFLWLSATTWMYPLLLPDEGRYVGVAWDMLISGDFFTPRIDGLAFFHKPPLFYWLTAASLSIFGDNAWAARFCSVLAATVLVTFSYLFLRRYTNTRAARRTAVILLVQPFLFGGAHYANLDMLVASLMGLTVLAGADAVFRFQQLRNDQYALILMYLAAAAGFLAKGLIGIVLPGGILFFWLLGRRSFAAMARLIWWPGIVLFLVLTLPWMILMQIRYPGFFDYYIIYQHFQRFLEPGFNNPHPFWFYIPVILALTLPWSIQLWRWFYPSGPLQPIFLDPADRVEQIERPVMRGLMLSWFLVVVVFFSIPSSKLVGYVLAALPPLAWFIQETFEQRIHESVRANRSFVRFTLIAGLICLLAVIALLLFPQRGSKSLAQQLSQAAKPGDKLIMLDQYAYDMPLYANWRDPIIAVASWDDPALELADDWRREFYDAAKFDPVPAKQRMWLKTELQNYVCQTQKTASWLVAWLDEAHYYPILDDLKPVKAARKMGLWYIPADYVPTVCGERPSNGSE